MLELAPKEFTWMVGRARRRARRKVIPFSIDAAYVTSIWSSSCTYCGIEMEWFSGPNEPRGYSIDRVIPNLGYVPGNVVISCIACNYEKGERSPEQIREKPQ